MCLILSFFSIQSLESVLLLPSLTELTERTILVGVHILANIMYNDCHHKQASNIVGRHHNGCNRSGKLQIDLMFYILHQHLGYFVF